MITHFDCYQLFEQLLSHKFGGSAKKDNMLKIKF